MRRCLIQKAAKRLLKHDCKVYYAKDKLITAAKLKDPSDSEPRDAMQMVDVQVNTELKRLKKIYGL